MFIESQDFGRHAPYKSDNLTPETAFQMLQTYRNQIEAKRKLEAEFRPKQELFGIEPANYKELEWVEQEIEKLTMVWEIRDGWNKEWDRLRTGSFQSLKLGECFSMGFSQKGLDEGETVTRLWQSCCMLLKYSWTL